MTSVHPISPHLTTLDAPAFMAALPSWLMWRFEANPKDDNAKPLKVPYYVNGVRRHGTQGSQEDRNQLVTFEVAKRTAMRRGFDGVGFCCLPENGVVAGDFDNCVSADGPGLEDANVHPQVLDLTLGTYAEYSPSGTGVRAFWRGEPRGNGKDPHGDPFGLEIFSTKGFVTFTGHALWQTEFNGCEDHLAWVPEALDAYITERLGEGASRSVPGLDGQEHDILDTYSPKRNVSLAQATEMLAHLDPNMARQPWLHVGMALHHEFDGSPEAFALWDTWSANGATYNEGTPIERVWDSFGKTTGAPVTMGTVQAMVNKAIITKVENEPVKGSEPQEDYAPRFVHVDEFAARSAHQEVLVKDLLPRATLGVLFGASGSGKTFMALDIALAIARGSYWRNDTKRTEKTGVAYVVAEGDLGLVKRLRAYRDHVMGTPEFGTDVPFSLIANAPDLMEAKTALEIAEKVNALPHEVGLVIIDTLAQTMRGDENSAQDMGSYAANCRAIYRRTGAMMMLIHHSGKDAARGMRGSSTLFAAADAVLEVVRQPEGRVIRASKMKDDGDDQVNYHFNLKPVVLGLNQYGEAITSCVVEHIEPQAAPKLTPTQQLVVEAIMALGDFQDQFEFEELVDEIFRIKDRRKVDGGGNPLEESSAKKRIRTAIKEYVELPNCGIEIVGDQITVTDRSKFIL